MALKICDSVEFDFFWGNKKTQKKKKNHYNYQINAVL